MTNADIKARLHDYVCAELLNDPAYSVADDTPLITGGLMDSFSLARIAVFIEEAFGVYIPDTDLTAQNMDTLTNMAACVAYHKGASS